LYQPIKKPRGQELSMEQKAYNQAVSRIRVQVEHVIGSTKRYRIVRDACRLRKSDFVGTVIHLCAGLHNFRVTRKPVQYPNHPKPKLT
ncbi:transposase family protein, partial [Spirosoma spitsbergense]